MIGLRRAAEAAGALAQWATEGYADFLEVFDGEDLLPRVLRQAEQAKQHALQVERHARLEAGHMKIEAGHALREAMHERQQAKLWFTLAQGIDTEDKVRAFFNHRQRRGDCQQLRIVSIVKVENLQGLGNFTSAGSFDFNAMATPSHVTAACA